MDEYEEKDLRRSASKLRDLEDIFEKIFDFRISYVWGSYMPTTIKDGEKFEAGIKAAREAVKKIEEKWKEKDEE